MTVLREEGFENFLKRQASAMNGILVHGNDSALVARFGRETVRAILGKTGEAERFSTEVLKDGAGRFADEFFSLSLLGERRVLWVDDVSDSNLKSLSEILLSPHAANFVFLAAESLSKTSKLRIACEESAKFASVAIYEDGIESARIRLRNLMVAGGLDWESGAEETFLEIVGIDRSVVNQEFEKLALFFLGQVSISAEDVLASCGDTAAFGADGLIDAMLIGDINDVDRMFANLDGESGGRRMILSTTAAHLSKLQDMRVSMEKGLGADLAVRNAKPPIFFKRHGAVLNQLRKFDADELLSMQQTLSAATFQSRKHADLADDIANRALLSLARLARSKSCELNR